MGKRVLKILLALLLFTGAFTVYAVYGPPFESISRTAVESAQGAVISYRHVSHGRLYRSDDMEFENLTISLPSLKPSLYELGAISKVKAFYSTGLESYLGTGCSESVKSGTVAVYELNLTSVLLEVRLQGECFKMGTPIQNLRGGKGEFHDFVLYTRKKL